MEPTPPAGKPTLFGSGFQPAGGETKDVFVIEAQQAIDPAITESALAIENHYSGNPDQVTAPSFLTPAVFKRKGT